MPTAQGVAAANAQTTNEAWIALLQLDHSSFASPIRLARNKVNVEHGGEVYVRFAFELTLPDLKEGSQAVGKIEMDDVGEFEDPDTGEMKTIGNYVMAVPVGDNITVTVTTVLGTNTEIADMEPEEFTLRKVHGDGLTVSGELHYEDLMSEPDPCDSLPA